MIKYDFTLVLEGVDEELSVYPETAVLTLAMKHIVKGNHPVSEGPY